MIQDLETKMQKFNEQLKVAQESNKNADKLLVKNIRKKQEMLLQESYENLTASDRVYIARHKKRPNTRVYIDTLFTDFFEMCGDRLCSEDASILGGVANFNGKPVTVIGHLKGTTLEENIKCNFGMPNPSGYRKVQRLVNQAEKFHRPIITFIDTPGAYPGIEAEKHGQGEAIAKCLALFSEVTVPVIAVIIGEGGSGGALALGVANTIIMLENSVYSILSPEGFASILWKDPTRKEEACEYLKLTSFDLKKLGVCDHIIKEGVGSVIINQENVMQDLQKLLTKELTRLSRINRNTIRQMRYDKFRLMGEVSENQGEN